MTNMAAFLEGLTERQVSELSAAMAYRASKSRGGSYLPTREEQGAWDALHLALGTLRGRVPPLSSFVTSYGASKWADRVKDLNAFIDSGCGMEIVWNVRSALMVTVVRLVVSYLRARDIAATPKTVLNSFVMMADAVDAQFPGYVHAKMLHRIAPVV